MLRPFQIVSDNIVYVAGVAEFQFPRTTKGSSRCAIIGISHSMTDQNLGEFPNAFGTILTRLSVAGRNYFSGRCPLPLISSEIASADAPNSGGNFANRFFGSHIPTPDVYLGGNTRCSGMAISGSEEIVMRLEQLDSEIPVTQVTLWCVQWPDDLDDPEQSSWEAMYKDGIGETLFIGNEQIGFPATGGGFEFSPLPQPPSSRALRRVGFRGVLTSDTGTTFGFEIAAESAPGFNNLLIEVDGDFSRPPQNRFTAARTMLGLIDYPVFNGIYDMQRNERSTVRVLVGGVGIAPDQGFIFYVVHMFEGRNFRTPPNGLLESATAIS